MEEGESGGDRDSGEGESLERGQPTFFSVFAAKIQVISILNVDSG